MRFIREVENSEEEKNGKKFRVIFREFWYLICFLKRGEKFIIWGLRYVKWYNL